MIGWRYQLPEVADLIICNLLCFGILQDESNFHNNCVQEKGIKNIKIIEDGVIKTTLDGEIPIPRYDDSEIRKFEGDFHKPTSKLSKFFHGENISMVFRNNGQFKHSFDKWIYVHMFYHISNCK